MEDNKIVQFPKRKLDLPDVNDLIETSRKEREEAISSWEKDIKDILNKK